MSIPCALLLVPPPAGAASEYDEVGGDDVQIARVAVTEFTLPVMDIAENGDIFVAVSVDMSGRNSIYIYRSVDGGDYWAYWGRLDSTDVDYSEPSLHIAEGTQDLLFVAFSYRGPSEAHRQIRVASSPLAAPSWTVQTALATDTDDFYRPSLNSDEVNFASYYLYLAAEGDDGNGNDIWFTRSTNYGASWPAGYKIGSLATGEDYRGPFLCYGRSGVVHCAWTLYQLVGNNQAVRYRRATNYAAGSGDWDPILYLTSNSDGNGEYHATVAASPGSDQVVAGWVVIEDATVVGSDFRSSSDAGATWGALTRVDRGYWAHVLALPGLAGFSMAGDDGTAFKGSRSAADATPLDWSDHQTVWDRRASVSWGSFCAYRYHDYDLTRGNRRGMVWMAENESGTDTLFFDAEWRRDPGYANLKPGFPLSLSSSVVAPPAICELDGDPESEIVFGLEDGRIVALDHDGSALPGWPVDIGTF